MRMVDPHDLPWPPREFVGHLKEALVIELVLNPRTFRIQVFASASSVDVPLISLETTDHQPTTLVWVGFFHVVVDFAHDG